MTVPAARLRIVSERDGGSSIVLTSPHAREVKVPGPALLKIGPLFDTVRDTLDKFLLYGSLGLNLRPQTAKDMITDFRKLGRMALATLVGPRHAGAAQKFSRFFQAVAEPTLGDSSPVLEVSSPVDLPFEILPVPWDDDADISTDPTRFIEQTTNLFLGFRFAIQRYGTNGHWDRPEDRVLKGNPGVSVAPYWHEKLDRVHRELAELGGLGTYDVRPPLPDRAVVSAGSAPAAKRVAELLVHDRPDREAIVHITAHCESSKAVLPLDRAIVFAAKDGWRLRRVRVSVGDLHGASQTNRLPGAPGPLAFISACGAADVQFTSPTSIPDVFLQMGYRSVISPLVKVHVEPAMEFALHFYRALGTDHTAGGALLAARVELLKRHRNPLGLAYCLHGEGSLRIEE